MKVWSCEPIRHLRPIKTLIFMKTSALVLCIYKYTIANFEDDRGAKDELILKGLFGKLDFLRDTDLIGI